MFDSEAVKCFEKTLELSSVDLMGATLQLAILGKREMPDKTPEPYMQEFYKKKSKGWSDIAWQKGKYRGHILIEKAFKQTHNTSKKVNILDLGCGTGSLARFLRPYARTLVGVDLSPDMLFKAQQIDLYDSLHKKDLSQYLGEVLNHYDTVVAAAVLIHFYDLDNIFFLVRDSLKINGRFIFSIFEETQNNRGLNSFLMYSHSDDYVTTLANRLNLKISYRQRDIHEYHKGASVPAVIYVLEKLA
jgi:predicted TPR repeat methyltransferase